MSRLQLYSTATAAALVLVMLPGTALAEPSSSELEDAAPVMTMPLTDSEGTPTETATALVDDRSAAHSPDEDAATQSDSALAQTTDAPESGTSEGGPIAILTEPLSVDNDFLVAGVTWGPDQQLAADSEISIRVREDGQWSDWYPMGSDGSGRDDGVGRPATEPFITGGADAVQVQVTGEAVDLPADLAVTMVPGNPQGEVTLDPDDVTPAPADPTPQAQVDEDSDTDETVPQETSSDGGATVDQSTESGTIPSDQSSTDGPSSGSGGSIGSGGTGVRDTRALLTSVAAASTAKDLPVNVITRAQWGANESYMTLDPEEATAPFVIVHHTVGTNDYSASQSAGIVNGIYYYHAVTLGWGDIGYNFLVDKYGQVFEGRAGSASATPGKMVAGAHAQGANTGTMGIAMMGTYTSVSPTSAELTAVGKMAGWQLSRAGVDPRGSATFTITYSNGKYNVGDKVTLNRVAGHRDVYATACPGDAGYAALSTIRGIAASVTTNTAPTGFLDKVAVGTGDSVDVVGWAYDSDTTSPVPIDLSIDGIYAGRVAASAPRTDVQKALGIRAEVGYSANLPASPGSHTVCSRAINTPTGDNPRLGCKTIIVSHIPQGHLDKVAATASGQIDVIGWAYDADTTSPLSVEITLDGARVTTVTASTQRSDVASALGIRSAVGYATSIDAPSGTHTVCAIAINVGEGTDQTQECKTVTVNRPPAGFLDKVAINSSGTVDVVGWAYDPDSTSPLRVDLSVDGAFRIAMTADQSRTDVQQALGFRPTVGYRTVLTLEAGTHTICTRAHNIPDGDNPRLGCRDVTVIGGFNAGLIISDSVMFNSSTMTSSQIQQFIAGKNSGCSSSSGIPCLKDYTVTTPAMTASYCSDYTAGTDENAASVIWKSAKACGINPQVLLVMLQKEQGLVNTNGANLTSNSYPQALGFRMSNSKYASFPAQIYYAASALVEYGERPTSYTYRAGQTVDIPFYTNPACGAATVTIQNRATAALYNYTPYQPNAAALANMYGTGDSCSTYGNRNFWRYFTDWFGSTI